MTQLANSRTTSSAIPAAGTDIAELLDIVRTVCDAQQVSVMSVDDSTHQVARLADVLADDELPGDEAAQRGSADSLLSASDLIGPSASEIPIISAKDGRRALAVRLATRGRQRLFLLLQFRSELASARAKALHLLPKLTRAVTRMLDGETRRLNSERERAAATAVLNQSSCGVIVATADGRPIVMNEAASALLDRGDGLHMRRGVIRPTSRSDAIRFQTALETTADGTEDGTAAIMLLQSRRADTPLIVTVAPAGTEAAAGPADEDEDAAVIIRLGQPDLDAVRGVEPVCHLLGLSRVETELVDQLYRGSTLTEAAGMMRIKVDTARGYLKQIFSKTETHRQTDLIALMSRYLRVVRGRSSFRSL